MGDGLGTATAEEDGVNKSVVLVMFVLFVAFQVFVVFVPFTIFVTFDVLVKLVMIETRQ